MASLMATFHSILNLFILVNLSFQFYWNYHNVCECVSELLEALTNFDETLYDGPTTPNKNISFYYLFIVPAIYIYFLFHFSGISG